mgnify:CR=1 FL=1|tara:strand:- start:1079 stop:1594 length:516 start_codon:yes stop_codon:yes gene_type:complete
MAIKGKAKYYSGAVHSSKRIVLEDAFVQNDEVVIEIAQPANTVIDNIFVRFLGNVSLDGNADVGYELGTTSSDNDIATNADGFLDNGTSIPEGCLFGLNRAIGAAGGSGLPSHWKDGGGVFTETQGDVPSPAVHKAYSETERTVFFTTLCSNRVVTGGNKIEINVMFINLS